MTETNKEKEQKNGYYTIVAPGSIQPNSDFAVTVTIHDHYTPATVKVTLEGPSYNDSQTVEVQPFSAEMVTFHIPDIEDGKYELLAEGIAGFIFKKQTELSFKNEKPKVYLQTDKAMYKPGDLVQYRILALDEQLKPAKLTQPLHLTITDGALNKIKHIKDLEFLHGVHTAKFQLTEQPVLGNWTLEVTMDKQNQPKATKQFEVAKYVLPKFSVEIEADKKVAILDREVKITVRSKYTYGQPVKGKATVSAKFGDENNKGAEKTLDIDGKGDVVFSFMDDLRMDQAMGYHMSQIHVEAKMTEGFTGIEQSAKSTIDVVRARYTITALNLEQQYEIDQPFDLKVAVKRLNGSPVQNARSTAKLFLSQQRHYMGFGRGSMMGGGENELMYESEVDANGVASFRVRIGLEGYYGNVRVMYEEKIENLNGFSIKKKDDENATESSTSMPGAFRGMEAVGPLKLVPKTTSPKLGEEIVIDVKSDNPIPYFVYTVIVRGKILRHEYVKVAGDKKCHCLKIKPTYDMSPYIKVFVYLVRDGELKFDETQIDVPNKFGNSLEITAPEEAKPSDMVSLQIKTEPDSFVGLLGVDQSVLLLQSGNDFDGDQISNDLSAYDAHSIKSEYSPGFHRVPGESSGFVTLTNACVPKPDYHIYDRSYLASAGSSFGMAMPMAMNAPAMPMGRSPMFLQAAAAALPPPLEIKIRKDFVENWIFDNIESTGPEGITNFTKKIPDTITSWVISGFSLNDHTGFGISKEATKIRVFQPFFVSTNLPYSIKRGEVVAIPVVVFNYMSAELVAEITMENSDGEYDFTDKLEDGEALSSAEAQNQRTKKLTIAANGAESLSFNIRPNIVGEVMLKIKAVTPMAGDIIHQKLKVEPEGVTKFHNEAQFISIGKEDEALMRAVKATIPEDVILDSEFLEFSAVSDILGPTIQNIDNLVRQPFGCGEQNMINFVPNILVLHYLDAIKVELPEIRKKAIAYMEKGYQRELTYKHNDGSYSAFGEGSSEANSWLTAYVARSFIQARKFITIDESLIESALKYLVTTQKPNGQFPQTGRLFHSSNQNELGVSAFIMLTFLEDEKYASQYKEQIEKGLKYLSFNAESEDNVYSLALLSLVFQKTDHVMLSSVLEKLEKSATMEKNLKWWGSSHKYGSNKIEVTSYVLQSLLEMEQPGQLLPILKWLIGQRNSLGGFDSTQDTVVGLQALIRFAEKYALGGNDGIQIDFQALNGKGEEVSQGSIGISKENALLLQSHVVPKSTREISFKANGQGSALVQFSYRYNIMSVDKKPMFQIKHTPQETAHSNQLKMNVCVEYQPQMSEVETKESNMAVMEIFLPSGYASHSDNLEPIRRAKQVQRVETKNSDTAIVVYFDYLAVGQPVCFDVLADKTHEVANLKPAAISVYDYYDAEQRATVYYEAA